MFKDIVYQLRLEGDGYYAVVDDKLGNRICFPSISIRSPISSKGYGTAAHIVKGMIEGYEKLNLPVASNLALMYKHYCNYDRNKANEWMRLDCEWMTNHYPNIQYKGVYFNCVLNQYKKLMFSKR